MEPSKVDLRRFRRRTGPDASESPRADAPIEPPASPWPESPTGRPLTLRIDVEGPGGTVSGTFELGERPFLIGRGAGHLKLPKSTIPARALVITAVPGGFHAAGLEGFRWPAEPGARGGATTGSTTVSPDRPALIVLAPYRLRLRASQSPGQRIKDLHATPAPAAERITPSAPLSPAAFGAPPRPEPPVQALAAALDDRPSPFGGGEDRLAVGGQADAFDADMTISEMSAPGLRARSQSVDPVEGLELAFVRADGPQEGQSYAVTELPLVIGRVGHGLQIHDKRVSSKHAQLELGGPWVYTLKDLASTNGTLVNGRPISITRIDDGDHVSFGGVGFTFQTRRV